MGPLTVTGPAHVVVVYELPELAAAAEQLATSVGPVLIGVGHVTVTYGEAVPESGVQVATGTFGTLRLVQTVVTPPTVVEPVQLPAGTLTRVLVALLQVVTSPVPLVVVPTVQAMTVGPLTTG